MSPCPERRRSVPGRGTKSEPRLASFDIVRRSILIRRKTFTHTRARGNYINKKNNTDPARDATTENKQNRALRARVPANHKAYSPMMQTTGLLGGGVSHVTLGCEDTHTSRMRSVSEVPIIILDKLLD